LEEHGLEELVVDNSDHGEEESEQRGTQD